MATRADATANKCRSRIWLADTDGSAPPRPLTAGEVTDSQPRWSPDGSQIAFTSHVAVSCGLFGASRQQNLLSLEWASDIAGQFFTEIGVRATDRPDLYEAMSPITYVRAIETPMLIIHSEDDIRCPIDQADQLFSALRTLDEEVEYYRFPGESHELSRAGNHPPREASRDHHRVLHPPTRLAQSRSANQMTRDA